MQSTTVPFVRDLPPPTRLRTTLGVVPRWLAHKSVEETTVTHLIELADDQVQLGCDLSGSAPDALPVIDAFRQGVMAACHTVFGVPLSSAFAMNAIAATLTPPGRDSLERQPSFSILMSFRSQWREGRLTATDVTAALMQGAVGIGTASAEVVVLLPGHYARVRGGRQQRSHRAPLERLPAERACVGSPREVLVAEVDAQGTVPIAIDTDHLAFCDHQVDHLPGMTLLEAVRQAMGSQGLQQQPLSWSARFLRYVEVEAPVVVDLSGVGPAGGVARVLEGDEAVLVVDVG